MTAKQKANRERFKKVVAEAKKLRSKNPKLSQAQAVKQAWAIMYSKTGTSKKVGAVKKKTTKKVAKKKATVKSYHKDTKSHNVNIKVISGVESDLQKKLNLALHFVGTYLSNIEFEKVMMKKDKERKNYWKLKLNESKKKLKHAREIVSKLKKAI